MKKPLPQTKLSIVWDDFVDNYQHIAPFFLMLVAYWAQYGFPTVTFGTVFYMVGMYLILWVLTQGFLNFVNYVNMLESRKTFNVKKNEARKSEDPELIDKKE